MDENQLKAECIAFAEYVAKQDLRWKFKSLDTLWDEYRQGMSGVAEAWSGFLDKPDQ
jgi:hypothetical protein